MIYPVYVYDAFADDFDNAGLVGALEPISCEHDEIAGGMSEVTLVHPLDKMGKWRALMRGNIIKCFTRVRTTPEINDGQITTTVEKWTVKDTSSKAERVVYSAKEGGKKLGSLKKGASVIVVRKPADSERYKVKCEKLTGWMDSAALSYEAQEVIGSDPTAIEDIFPAWGMKQQLFRITGEIRALDSITVTARHITYDLLGNMTLYKNAEAVSLIHAATRVLERCITPHPFTVQTNIADTRTGVDWRHKNPIFAYLDPDEGIAKRWDCQLVRDNYEFTFLKTAGKNRGLTVEYAKNLMGVNCEITGDEVVTRVLPTGLDKDGNILYLTDDLDGENWIDADNIAGYATPHIYHLECENCQVADDLSIDKVRARMREQAQELLDSGVTMPQVSIKVEFLNLGATEEYARFRDMEQLDLYDKVRVKAPRIGVNALLDAVRVRTDCITGKPLGVEIGALQDVEISIESYQIGGLSGGKIFAGTIGGPQLGGDVIKARHISAGSIYTDALQAKSVTADKIAAGSINADKIVAGSITADKITAGAIVTEKLAAASVTADKIAAGSVTAEKIEAGTITAQQLKAGLITADSGLIAVGAIQTAQIADGSITSAKIVELSADVIKSGTLQTDRLLLVGEGGVVYEINALSSGLSQTELSDEKYRSYINGTVIVANSITAAQIAAGTITANEIAANAITAAKINVADLFASEATISAINAMDIRSNTYLQLYVGDRINGISVGGRNLWLRTREYDPAKYGGWTGGGAPYTTIDGFGVQRISGAWNDISQNVPVEAGAEYTLSAWIKWEDAANTGTFYLFHSGGSVDVTAQVGTTDYARVSATYEETDSTSSCRFECSTDAPYLIYGLKLEKGNKATDWSPAPEDPVSEVEAGSVVEINKNRVKISTPEFAVDIPTTEGMDVQVNEKGFSAPVISSPTVAKARPGGVYTVGAGGDYACLADAFGDINDCAISEDVWLRMLDGADAGGLLRGVSGAGQVLIAPANLANFSDTAAWTTQNNVNVNVLGSGLGVSISSSTTGAWKWAYLHVGRVGPLGLRGKTLTLSADMYSNQNAAGLVMQMIVRLNDTAIRYVTRPNVADLTAPATAVASFTISEEAGFWDELNIVFQLNQGTSVPVGAAAFYYNIRMEPGNAVSDAAAGKCTATIGDLRIEGCAAQVNISEIIFPRALEARQSAAALNRCTFKGADGFRLFGGHGYMENCYGSCSATAVYAGGGGAVQITGSAPSGTKAGLLETSGMDAGDPPSGGTPAPEVSKTITAKATSSGTYDGVNGWWSSDAALRQGYVSGNGRLRGGVWFDLSALPSGATITKLTLRLRRVEGYGKGSAVDVRIYGTTASAKSGDPAASGKISSSYVSGSMEPGKTKTFDVTSLKAYTGFVLYAADNAVLSGKSYSTNFARFTGTGGGDDTIPLLTVTYTA